MRVPITNEDTLQMHCVEEFSKRWPHYANLIHHSPNGGKRIGNEGARFKAMGTRSGWPDLVVMVQRGGYGGLFIELKYEDGSLSVDQKRMIELLRAQGYRAEVHRSVESFMATCADYIGREDL